MNGTSELLDLCRATATRAGLRLQAFTQEHKDYVHSRDLAREIKARADTVLEQDILQALAPTGLAILSEESGDIPGREHSSRRFIVDPLDGTYNFVKGLGPCGVSIALWEDQTPIFGVIYSLLDRQLFWGGAAMGSHTDGQRLVVSVTPSADQGAICTGFPVRFDVTNDLVMQDFWRTVRPYAKVRMLGSAALALLQVARGSADAYFEKSIMLWDVAAGIAIVEGAGGRVKCVPTKVNYSLDVYASNGIVSVGD